MHTTAADYGTSRIRLIHANGTVATIAGSWTAGGADGPAATATLHYPTGLALSPDALALWFSGAWGRARVGLGIPTAEDRG
jgi:hypothetical protein